MLKLKNKIYKVSLIVLFLAIMTNISSFSNATTQDLDYNNKLIDGKDICYWIDSSCQYTATIPSAVSALRYPSGMWNPIVLTKTTVKSQSKIDFYQENSNQGYSARTNIFARKTNGQENQLGWSQADYQDWLYGKIYLNDTDLDGASTNYRMNTVLHEMLHVYGLKDIYDDRGCIMYGGVGDWTIVGLTRDANNILVQKYNY